VIGLPPSEDGADHDNATWPLPGVPDTPVGAVGTVAGAEGVTADEAADCTLVPTELIAATVNVYAVPFVSPVTVKLVAAEPVSTGPCATPPMYGVTA
jgi:hypothetical protein